MDENKNIHFMSVIGEYFLMISMKTVKYNAKDTPLKITKTSPQIEYVFV